MNEPVPADAPLSEDPLEMLRLNRANEKAADTVFDQSPAPVVKKSRRTRDYLIILVTVNSIFGCWFFLVPNIIIFAGILFFSASLTWGMLFVMDDY